MKNIFKALDKPDLFTKVALWWTIGKAPIF